jgi:cell wall assembly regulator SMI1
MSKSRLPITWSDFKAHLKKEGYEVSKTFRKPATPEAIQKLEDAVAVPLPEAFKAFYLVNNGQRDDAEGLVPAEGILHGDFYMMPLSEILSDWKMMNELLDIGEFEGEQSRVRSHKAIRKEWWNRAWIPFATDGGGDHVCLDFAPAKSGVAGQVIFFHHDSPERELLAPSFEQWLTELFEEWMEHPPSDS